MHGEIVKLMSIVAAVFVYRYTCVDNYPPEKVDLEGRD